jgi:hypothetical protein
MSNDISRRLLDYAEDELAAQVDALVADSRRYRWLRRAAVQLSLSNDTIAGLVKDQAELDGAIKGETP